MSIVNDKKKIFGHLAALKTLNGGMPKLNNNNSLPSILVAGTKYRGQFEERIKAFNNKQNSIDFLIDIQKIVIGIDELRDTLVDALTYKLPEIELQIKKSLKLELKGLINCGVDPSIPTQLKSSGFDIELKKLDFLDIMHINPNSLEGGLIFNDVSAGFNSNDFNTFLSNVIQDANNSHEWSVNSTVTANPILDVTFRPNGVINNQLNIKTSSYYSNPLNKKTLSDLNNDFIDSINLLSTDKILTSLIDSVLGTISSSLGKSLKQLEIEGQVDTIITKIMSTQETEIIDDSFFSFSNDEIYYHQQQASNRKRGIVKVAHSTESDLSLPIGTLKTGIDDITKTSSGTLNEQKIVLNKTINSFSDSLSQDLDNEDKYSAKLNFIESLLRKMVQVIVSQILSPKFILIFTLNHIIMNTGTVVNSAIDFMQKNKTLIKNLINTIRDIIIKILLERAIKAISELVLAQLSETQAEKLRATKAQLFSLIGIPQDVIRTIQKLGASRGISTTF